MSSRPVALFTETSGSGPPVLLVPGLGYASWCWQQQDPLAKDWRLTKIDPRGAGRSPKPSGPYSISQMAADIAGTVGGVEPFHVVGHSLGGYLAMTLALTNPEIVRSLTLVATSAGGDDHHPVPDETRQVWLREAGKPSAEYARATMHLSFSPGWSDTHPDEYEQWLERRIEFPTPPEAWAAQYEAGTNHLQAGLDVEGISIPTLIVHGTADRILPFENSVLLAQRIPRSRLVTVEGIGHLIPLERPEMFNSLVFGFWWGVEAS